MNKFTVLDYFTYLVFLCRLTDWNVVHGLMILGLVAKLA